MAKEYAVEVLISGRATVFTRADSADEAAEKVENGDFYGGDIIEWSAEDVRSVEVNDENT